MHLTNKFSLPLSINRFQLGNHYFSQIFDEKIIVFFPMNWIVLLMLSIEFEYSIVCFLSFFFSWILKIMAAGTQMFFFFKQQRWRIALWFLILAPMSDVLADFRTGNLGPAVQRQRENKHEKRSVSNFNLMNWFFFRSTRNAQQFVFFAWISIRWLIFILAAGWRSSTQEHQINVYNKMRHMWITIASKREMSCYLCLCIYAYVRAWPPNYNNANNGARCPTSTYMCVCVEQNLFRLYLIIIKTIIIDGWGECANTNFNCFACFRFGFLSILRSVNHSCVWF